MDDFEVQSHREHASVRAWIGVLIACLGLFGAYVYLKPRLTGQVDQQDEQEEALASADDDKGKKKTRRRRRKRRRKKGKRRSRRRKPARESTGSSIERFFLGDDSEEEEEEEGVLLGPREGFMENDPYAVGNIHEDDPDPRPQPTVTRKPKKLPPPPPELWNPRGRYRPVARHAEPGSDKVGVVSLDLSSGKSRGSGALKPSQIQPVLNERALMRCYNDAVQRAPRMRGRVHMDFTVAPDGHVSRAIITRSQLRSRIVERCIVNKAKHWRFPRTSQATKFDTHFDFSSR